jgi:hypothetical protein
MEAQEEVHYVFFPSFNKWTQQEKYFSSRSYKTFFLRYKDFFRFLLVNFCICYILKKKLIVKWPSLTPKKENKEISFIRSAQGVLTIEYRTTETIIYFCMGLFYMSSFAGFHWNRRKTEVVGITGHSQPKRKRREGNKNSFARRQK